MRIKRRFGILLAISLAMVPLYSLADTGLTQLTTDQQPTVVDDNTLARAKTEFIIAQAKFTSLQLELREAEQTITRTRINIRELETKLQNAKLASHELANGEMIVSELSANLAYQHSLLTLEQVRRDVLNQVLTIAEQNLTKQSERQEKIIATYQLQHQKEQRKNLEQLAQHLQGEQKRWLEKLVAYNREIQQLANNNDPVINKRRQALEGLILEAEEKSSINHLNLISAQLESQYEGLIKSLEMQRSIAELSAINTQVDSVLRQINSITVLIKTKIDSLQKRLTLEKQSQPDNLSTIANNNIRNMLNGFISTYQAQLTAFNILLQQYTDYQKNLRIELGKALAKRQELPGFDRQEWQIFLAKVWVLPELIWQSLQTVGQQVVQSVERFSWWQWLLLIGYQALLLGLWKVGRFYLKKLYLSYYHEEEPLTKNTFFVVLKLIRRNLFGLILAFNVFSLLAFNQLNFKSYALFFSFTVVWFGYRFAQGLARLALLETVTATGGEDARLYHKLKWLFAVAAVLIALLIAARQLPVDYSVNDFINRLFMLQLLLASGLVIRSWQVLPSLFNAYLEERQVYLKRAIRWLSLLIPVALIINAIVGLVGYVELAWTMSAYQGLFILVMLGYVFIRSLLVDLMDWVSRLLVLNVSNGWVWSEAFLKPLDKLLRLCFLIAAGALLFYLYGWDQHTYFVELGKKVITHSMTFANNQITVLDILGGIFVILVLAWIGRWSRELSYRWLYAHYKDLGVRNSLAVFTQYITVILSVYVALRLSGLDFTSLNYILGGVSLGAGLGLRDLVNNFASGILLLIERPVKKGDIVTIGTYEGEVTHIGMRAIVVRTWDHMEVLVPNSEAFSKSFTNWTHEDMIIRTVVPIRIQRVDDPYHVKAIIIDTLKKIADVLEEPYVSVYLKELSEPLILFEVRYFINIQLAGSRSRVRSDVLYAIWEAFKKHGIQPPNAPQDVQLELLNPQVVRELTAK